MKQHNADLMKQFHKFFSPLQKRWKTTLLFTFGVQHVIEEFIPHLREKRLKISRCSVSVYLDLPPSPQSPLDDPPWRIMMSVLTMISGQWESYLSLAVVTSIYWPKRRQ